MKKKSCGNDVTNALIPAFHWVVLPQVVLKGPVVAAQASTPAPVPAPVPIATMDHSVNPFEARRRFELNKMKMLQHLSTAVGVPHVASWVVHWSWKLFDVASC